MAYLEMADNAGQREPVGGEPEIGGRAGTREHVGVPVELERPGISLHYVSAAAKFPRGN